MTADFMRDVQSNPNNRAILSRWSLLDLPESWLVAGCLFQTIWNLKVGRIPQSGIKDYDLFYFDPTDLSKEGEMRAQIHAESVLGDLGLNIEVTNQARVHLWYPDHFGHSYPQLASVEYQHEARTGPSEALRHFLQARAWHRPDEVQRQVQRRRLDAQGRRGPVPT